MRAHEALSKAGTEHKGTFGMALIDAARLEKPVELDGGRLAFPFSIDESMTNRFDALHGGAYAALADVFTTAHLWGLEPSASHVSVDFNIQYYKGCPRGTAVQCVTDTPRVGGRLAYTRFSFVDRESGTVFAEGTHTKAMIRSKSSKPSASKATDS